MRTRCLALAVALVAALVSAGAALAADIVTVPTANQVSKGQVDLAYYHINLDWPEPMAQWVKIQTLAIGITDSLELGAHRYDVDGSGDDTIWNVSYRIMDESALAGDIVVGARDLTEKLSDTSYYVSVAKTLNPPVFGAPMKPVVRGHLSLGTSDNSLLGETRHEGLFGGVEVTLRARPVLGLVALHDGQDLISAITYKPAARMPVFKGGTFGSHWWVGVSYTVSPPGT